MHEMDLFKTRKTESLWFQQSIDLLWHMIYTSKLHTFTSWTSTQWQLEVDPCFSLGQECLWWALNQQGQTLAPPATRKVRQTHPSAQAIYTLTIYMYFMYYSPIAGIILCRWRHFGTLCIYTCRIKLPLTNIA